METDILADPNRPAVIEMLYNKYSNLVLRIRKYYAQNLYEAEEATQKVFN